MATKKSRKAITFACRSGDLLRLVDWWVRSSFILSVTSTVKHYIISIPEKSYKKHLKNIYSLLVDCLKCVYAYFDYVIIDEASQMFTEMGLALMWLAKTKVIAGDHQQLQPSSWFQTRNTDDAEDTPEHATSLLDYAADKGVHSVMLEKNYRSEAMS